MNTLEFSTAIPDLRFLPTIQLIRLAQHAERLSVPKHDTYKGGMARNAPALYLLKGMGLHIDQGPQGRGGEIYWARQWLHPASLMLPTRQTFAILAAEPLDMLAIQHDTLISAARKNPDLALYLAEQCAHQVSHLLLWRNIVATHSTLGRIAQLLLRMGRHYGSYHFHLTLTSSQLASYLGCSREAFTRGLTELARKGYIQRTAHTVKIIDQNAMGRIV